MSRIGRKFAIALAALTLFATTLGGSLALDEEPADASIQACNAYLRGIPQTLGSYKRVYLYARISCSLNSPALGVVVDSACVHIGYGSTCDVASSNSDTRLYASRYVTTKYFSLSTSGWTRLCATWSANSFDNDNAFQNWHGGGPSPRHQTQSCIYVLL